MIEFKMILESVSIICVIFIAFVNYTISKRNRKIAEENMKILRIIDDMALIITEERNHKGIQ